MVQNKCPIFDTITYDIEHIYKPIKIQLKIYSVCTVYTVMYSIYLFFTEMKIWICLLWM